MTWGPLRAHGGADQYVVYVDPATHRIDRVAYTIREAKELAPWALRWLMPTLAVGTMHYRDLRSVEGAWLSFDQIVTLGDGEKTAPPEDRVFHRVSVHEAHLDVVGSAVFCVAPDLPLGSDGKLGATEATGCGEVPSARAGW